MKTLSTVTVYLPHNALCDFYVELEKQYQRGELSPSLRAKFEEAADPREFIFVVTLLPELRNRAQRQSYLQVLKTAEQVWQRDEAGPQAKIAELRLPVFETTKTNIVEKL